MACENLYKAMRDAARAIAPPWVNSLGHESHMFDYVEAFADTSTTPHYAWDVVRILRRAGYPADRLLEGVLEIFERVIAYRQACLEMSGNILFRMLTEENEKSGDLSIERHEFPQTNLGRALSELNDALEAEKDDDKMMYIGESMMLLQRAISDWEHDHAWSQRLAQAVFDSIRPGAAKTGYAAQT